MKELEEGQPCPLPDCSGRLQFVPAGECTCFLSAPCYACENSFLECDECSTSEDEILKQLKEI